jgi:LysM repeat protein
MENINKKDFSRIYELMSFDRGKTLYEMEQKWDNILNEDAAPGGLTGTWDAATNTYTIAKGDYLSKIAKAFGVDWKKMYEDNKSTLKSGDPNLVYPGEKVVITGSSVSTETTSTTTTSTTASPNANSTVKLKYDANALLYYAMERRKKSMEPGGDLANSEKYGNLALYFQDVRDNKAQDVTKYKLTQADVDTFISEFEKMIAGNTELLNKYIANGKNTTVTNVAGSLEFKTSSTVPGDVNGDGVVDTKDLPKDQTMDNSGATTGGEDLDYDADSEGFEEQEPEMDREVDTTRTMEIKTSNNVWGEFFGNKLEQ